VVLTFASRTTAPARVIEPARLEKRPG